MNMRFFNAGIKKELWEFQQILFWLPVILASLAILLPVIQYLLIEDYQRQNIIDFFTRNGEQIRAGHRANEIRQMAFVTMSGLFTPFIITSFIVQLYYFTTCLFDERRDLSIYFWRSLPVSDASTIGFKLLTGALVIPAIFMLAATAILLVFVVFALLVTVILQLGYDVSLWSLWANIGLISNLAKVWLNLLPYLVWLLPIYTWLMLASMLARKAPFLWAVLPITILLLAEVLVVQYFDLSSYMFLPVFAEYFAITPELIEHSWSSARDVSMAPFNVLLDKVSLGGTVLAAGFLYSAYWLRVNRSYT